MPILSAQKPRSSNTKNPSIYIVVFFWLPRIYYIYARRSQKRTDAAVLVENIYLLYYTWHTQQITHEYPVRCKSTHTHYTFIQRAHGTICFSTIALWSTLMLYSIPLLAAFCALFIFSLGSLFFFFFLFVSSVCLSRIVKWIASYMDSLWGNIKYKITTRERDLSSQTQSQWGDPLVKIDLLRVYIRRTIFGAYILRFYFIQLSSMYNDLAYFDFLIYTSTFSFSSCGRKVQYKVNLYLNRFINRKRDYTLLCFI